MGHGYHPSKRDYHQTETAQVNKEDEIDLSVLEALSLPNRRVYYSKKKTNIWYLLTAELYMLQTSAMNLR